MMTKSRAKNMQWLRLCFCGLRGWEAPPSEVSEWVTQQMCQGLGRKNKLNNSSLGTRPRVPLFVVIKIRVGTRLSNERKRKKKEWIGMKEKTRRGCFKCDDSLVSTPVHISYLYEDPRSTFLLDSPARCLHTPENWNVWKMPSLSFFDTKY